jgi:hypothetical protein
MPGFLDSEFVDDREGLVGTHDDIIRASEIGEYAYCARAWWLRRVKGSSSANVAAMQRGKVRHRAHGRLVEGYHLRHRLARIALLCAMALLLACFILILRGGG